MSNVHAGNAGGNANELYVGQLYRNLLQRDADGAGLAAFTNALDNGQMTRAQVVQAFIDVTLL